MLIWARAVDPALVSALGYATAADAVADERGEVLRRLPRGITLRHPLAGAGPVVFRKLRRGRVADARNEWHRLHQLPGLGVRAPVPVFLATVGEHSAVGMLEVPGEPVDRLLAAERDPGRRRRFVLEVASAVVARLHGAGLFHRDLYWSHWFARSLDDIEPQLIDVERMIEPARWRRRRWRVKDLAALVSSWPIAGDVGTWARLIVRLDGRLDRRLLRAVLRKAARIRAHVPRHSGAP
ncbi:MAG: hypothetical protein IPM29_03510 [Planctomycetes bacterium]|nr:hypothetical protein [Planctomycetota bacterium]